MQNNIDLIILKSTPKQKTELSKYIDKLLPKDFINTKLYMLKKHNAKSLISLVKANTYFRSFIINEVVIIENLLLTGLYNSDYRDYKCLDIINDKYPNFFPKNKTSNRKFIFKRIILQNKLLDKTLLQAFISLTFGGKIRLIDCMDKEIAENLIKSRKNSFTKKNLLFELEICRKLRNHVVHNVFILDEKPYIIMYDQLQQKTEAKSDLDKIRYLFNIANEILRISGHTDLRRKAINYLNKHNINTDDLNILLFKK